MMPLWLPVAMAVLEDYRDERLRVRHWRIAATVSPHVSDGRAVYGVPPLADQFSKNHDEQL